MPPAPAFAAAGAPLAAAVLPARGGVTALAPADDADGAVAVIELEAGGAPIATIAPIGIAAACEGCACALGVVAPASALPPPAGSPPPQAANIKPNNSHTTRIERGTLVIMQVAVVSIALPVHDEIATQNRCISCRALSAQRATRVKRADKMQYRPSRGFPPRPPDHSTRRMCAAIHY